MLLFSQESIALLNKLIYLSIFYKNQINGCFFDNGYIHGTYQDISLKVLFYFLKHIDLLSTISNKETFHFLIIITLQENLEEMFPWCYMYVMSSAGKIFNHTLVILDQYVKGL